MGLLPEIASDFAVSDATAGYLISGYALSVAVGAIVITAAVTRLDRKKVLLALMELFIVGNMTSGATVLAFVHCFSAAQPGNSVALRATSKFTTP